jgi:hypothetical protein
MGDEEPRRHRCGKDTTIERVAAGAVRLVRWRRVEGLGSIAETLHEWTAEEWCDAVVAVSAPPRLDGEGNRALVLVEVGRIHRG